MADAAHSTEALLHASSVPLTKLNGFQDLLDPPSDDLASDSNVNAIEPHVSQVNRVSLDADESYAKTAEEALLSRTFLPPLIIVQLHLLTLRYPTP